MFDTVILPASPELSHPDNSSLKPVLKIDIKGKILFANAAVFEFLHDLSWPESDHLPAYFTGIYPGIFDSNADCTLAITTGQTNFLFDVIGFEEAGYIGLYGVSFD
jgi:hypothetical protein